jgi:hypothetical protein
LTAIDPANWAVVNFREACLLFANVAALHSAIMEKEPKDFVSHYIFEPVPFAFNSDLPAWIGWKTTLARLLEVDPQDIVLIGTAAIGYSLNPHKAYKAFDDTSDIDCSVISPYHFELAWRYLRQLRPSWLSLPSSTRRAIEIHRKNYVFSGTIASDSILALLPFGSIWQSALDEMSKIPPTVGKSVKLRIYKDYDALRHYQASGIERLRSELGDTDSVEAEIPVED